MRRTFLLLVGCATVHLAAHPAAAGAQSAAPRDGRVPLNVIRPSDPAVDPALDTSRTVFFPTPRVTDPSPERPGDDLVVWRSTSPLVRGIAGADPIYLQAYERLERPVPAARPATIGASAGPVFFAGFWGVADDEFRERRSRRPGPGAAPSRPDATVPPLAPLDGTIGGVRWAAPRAPSAPPPPARAAYPISRRPRG